MEETDTQIDGQDEEEEQDGDKDVIMAVDYRGRRLGCSFYTEQDEILWFVNDIEVNMLGSSGGPARELLENRKCITTIKVSSAIRLLKETLQ